MATDNYPDKDRHVNHKFIVQPATQEGLKANAPLEVDGKKFTPDKNGRMWVDDPGVARAIEQKYGKDEYVVSRVRAHKPVDMGHTYHFKMPLAPWKDPEELARRIQRNLEKGYES